MINAFLLALPDAENDNAAAADSGKPVLKHMDIPDTLVNAWYLISMRERLCLLWSCIRSRLRLEHYLPGACEKAYGWQR